MAFPRAQGAMESTDLHRCASGPLVGSPTSRSCRSAARTCCGQGATEYLVLLAVVLIIALVSVALLGFFPGMASDAQHTQSEMYLQSATPIAIVGISPAYRNDVNWPPNTAHAIHMRIRNTGSYPIRLQKMFGGGNFITQYYDYVAGATRSFSDIYLAPGEETCFGNKRDYFGSGSRVPADSYTCSEHTVVHFNASANSWYQLGALSNFCGTDFRGSVAIKNFGFEYIQYMEGQQITKRMIGAKDLMLQCA